jgi:glucose uptake protein
MYFPASHSTSLLIVILAAICWGSWANMQKLARPRRYELYSFDFILGLLAVSAAAAYTFGSWNAAELTFQENLLVTGYRNMAWAVGAGMVFSIGYSFLAAAVSVSGLAVAFPISMGVALVVGAGWDFTTGIQKGALLAMSGSLLVLIAVAVVGYAYGSHVDHLLAAIKQPAFRPDPRARPAGPKPVRPPSAAQARPGAAQARPSAAQTIVLGVISGFAFGFLRPLVDNARAGDNGVAPYSLALLLGGGMLAMTLAMTPFLFNFPVSGGPLGLRDLSSGSAVQHLYGILGGALAGASLLGGFVIAVVPGAAGVAPGLGYAIAQGGTVLAALWGLLAWREFGSASGRIRILFAVVLVLFALGVGMLSLVQT